MSWILFRLVSGFTIRENDNQQTFTNKLKYVHLLVVKQKKCTKSVKKMRTGNLPSVTNNMFCVGVPEGGKDSCHGDSGSPLALKDNRRQFWAAGIVSWVVDCRWKGTYGIYTRVANYLVGINETMQANWIYNILSQSLWNLFLKKRKTGIIA